MQRLIHKFEENGVVVDLPRSGRPSPSDDVVQTEFAKWFLDKMDSEEGFEQNILWSDETHFHLERTLPNSNCIIWSNVNPHVHVTTTAS